MITPDTVYLTYDAQYDSYVVEQSTIDDIIKQNKIPNIVIKGIDFDENAPVIGTLLSKQPQLYSISASDVHSIKDAGGAIKMMDYHNTIDQMNDIDGLYLAGGRFNTPAEYYQHDMPANHTSDIRGLAYVNSIKYATTQNMPILGVCAGSQMIGGAYDVKMTIKIDSNINHNQPSTTLTHPVKLTGLLKNMFKTDELTVNSVHNEALILDTIKNTPLTVYAISPDGILEASGNEKKNILAIQWHPEVMYHKLKDKSQLKIFKWLIDKAKIYYNKKLQNNT